MIGFADVDHRLYVLRSPSRMNVPVFPVPVASAIKEIATALTSNNLPSSFDT